MPCEQCSELCIRYSIRLPEHLRKAIRIARQHLEDGTLTERTASDASPEKSFAATTSGEAWCDFIDYQFLCSNCGEQFRLHAETYHGGGGFWEPAETSSIQDDIQPLPEFL